MARRDGRCWCSGNGQEEFHVLAAQSSSTNAQLSRKALSIEIDGDADGYEHLGGIRSHVH